MDAAGEGARAVPGVLRVSGAALSGAALFLGLVWGAVQALPHLAWPWVVLVWALISVPVALTPAWAAAVRGGHAARLWQGQGRAVFYRGGLRVLVAGGVALGASGLMLLRLSDGVPVLWALAGLAAGLPVILTPILSARLAHALTGLHALRLALRMAVAVSVGLVLAAHAVLAWAVLPAPGLAAGSAAASALLAEGLTLARLWAGLEGFALGQVAEFGDWGRWAAAALSLAGQAGVYGALALGGAAALLAPGEWRRALAPATDAPAQPAAGRAGVAAAVVLLLMVMAAAGWAERELRAMPVPARPASQAQVAAEWIGDALYRAGTYERIAALRSATLAEDHAAITRLEGALDAAFDAMEGNVDPFLDGYYTLWSDYLRFFAWATGGLEGHLTRRLEETLGDGIPFAAFEHARAAELSAMAGRHADLIAQENALLETARLSGVNPGRLRLIDRNPPLPDLRAAFEADLARAQMRWGAATGAGALAGVMAGRVAGRLAARGVLRGAARMLGRVAGLAVALGADYALVKLDEYQNRDAFRAEILTEITRLRTEARAALSDADQR